MNTSRLIARVRELVPAVVDPSLRVNPDGTTGYFVCTLAKKMRSVFFDNSSVWIRKTEEQLAIQIANELKA